MVENARPADAAGSLKRGAGADAVSPLRSEAPISGQDKPAAEPNPPVQPAAPLGDELIAVAQDAAVERAKGLVDDLSGRTRAALEKSAKIGEELSNVTKGNVEAVVASSHAAAGAAETLGRQAADYGKKRIEKAAAALSKIAAAKTPAEMIDVQSDYVRGSVDEAMARASLFGDLWAKTARDVVEPLSSRYAVTAEKMLIVVR